MTNPSPVFVYSLMHLLTACRNAGIAVTSKPTYLKYERMGVFLPGHQSVLYDNRIERLFTKDEIEQNIERYKVWKRDSLQRN